MAFFNTDGMGNSMLGGVGQFGSNMFSSWWNNYLAEQRENRARKANYKYNEMAAQEADKRQRAQYKDLYSPQAQMQQLQEAGLSPSIYASGGVAGKSGAGAIMGNGASGVSPNMYAAQPVSALEAAQIGKLNAETKNIEAQTENETGEGAIGQAQIAEMYANAENALKQAGYYNAATKLSEYQTNHQKLQNMLLEITMPSQIKQIEYQAMNEYAMAHKAFQEARKTGLEADFLNETMDERQQQILLENIETFKYCLLLDSEVNLNDAQIDKWISDTWIAWKNSDIYEQDINQQGEWLTNRVEQFAIENGLRKEEIKSFNTRTWVEGTSYTLGSAFNAVATIYTRGAAGAPKTTKTFTDPFGTTYTTTTKGKTSPKPFNKLPKVPTLRLNFRK